MAKNVSFCEPEPGGERNRLRVTPGEQGCSEAENDLGIVLTVASGPPVTFL